MIGPPPHSLWHLAHAYLQLTNIGTPECGCVVISPVKASNQSGLVALICVLQGTGLDFREVTRADQGFYRPAHDYHL